MFPFNHISDDEEFIVAISESWTCDTVSYNELKQQHKLFTPFDLNESENTPLYDIDPDIQFYANQISTSLHKCDYYLEDGFNKSLSSIDLSGKCISLLHINIRSAVKNLK